MTAAMNVSTTFHMPATLSLITWGCMRASFVSFFLQLTLQPQQWLSPYSMLSLKKDIVLFINSFNPSAKKTTAVVPLLSHSV